MLIGTFCLDTAPYLQAFTDPTNLIYQFPVLKDWVVISELNNVGLGVIAPRDALPDLFLEPLKQLSHFIAASNPCRLEIWGGKYNF